MFDTTVIGGSFAGLTAALQLERASRSVVVIEAGRPRNRTSPAAHGVVGWDGVAPTEILARFRADLAAYLKVQFREGTVTRAQGGPNAFKIKLDGSEEIESCRIVLAHGVRDILPDIPEVVASWGRCVLHCPDIEHRRHRSGTRKTGHSKSLRHRLAGALCRFGVALMRNEIVQ